ncbi:MAG: hypothetical protein G01um101424_85 [Parcubacteria group bacterium Gr01-1014_24]|nr:MAG: hypothetical protein G01um101424_85 [Parcubacteria group bacterium Gr01-1014_24]
MAVSGAVLFTYSPVLSYAQYSQVNTYGNIYTYVDNYSQLYITTTNAINITSSSAILNGLVNGNNLYNTYNLSTWFEYGKNTNLGYSTPQKSSNSGYANYSSNIAGLDANTIYYFRAVAQSPQQVVYGSINAFRTNFQNIVNIDNNNTDSLTPTVVATATKITSNNKTQLNTKKQTRATSNVKDATVSSFGANVFGTGSFFPTNIFGWLILLILILILILISKHLYRKFLDKK